MNSDYDEIKFRENGGEMVDYIADYMESLSQRRVTPNVSAGYLKSSLPSNPPQTGESFENIIKDVENYIMPGVIHWQHPGFHAHPGSSSYPAILGSMLADTLGCIGFNWDISPCRNELEAIVMDWYGRIIGLPKCFLNSEYFLRRTYRGAAVMQHSTTECIFLMVVSARLDVLGKFRERNPAMSYSALLSSLVVYCSGDSHPRMKSIAMLAMVNIKILETDENNRLLGKTVDKAIQQDRGIGLIPFFVNITIGKRSSGACDSIDEIGPICEKNGLWLHVDASYGGNAMVCPEFQHHFSGMEYASSVNVNPAKWMLASMDCAVLFVKDKFKITDALLVDRTRFGYSFSENDWCYPCKTEFRAMKLLFLLKSYGKEGIQRHIRNHVHLAEVFAEYVRNDERFELVTCNFSIVCFRLKGSDESNELLIRNINSSGALCLTSTCLSEIFVIGYIVCTERANEEDGKYAWEIICEHAENILNENKFKLK